MFVCMCIQSLTLILTFSWLVVTFFAAVGTGEKRNVWRKTLRARMRQQQVKTTLNQSHRPTLTMMIAFTTGADFFLQPQFIQVCRSTPLSIIATFSLAPDTSYTESLQWWLPFLSLSLCDVRMWNIIGIKNTNILIIKYFYCWIRTSSL